MVINYYGKQFFKITLGDLTIALDPISKESDSKGARFGADICLSTFNHPDTNGIENVSYGDKKAVAIFGPGEYEVKDVFIKGFNSKSNYERGGLNTIYIIKLEEMNLLFLGAHGEDDLPAELKEELDDVDVLFMPISKNTLSASTASKLSTKLEPKIIIPMAYEIEDLKAYLKEEGEGALVAVEKLVLKKKDLAEKEGEIVVLNPSS